MTIVYYQDLFNGVGNLSTHLPDVSDGSGYVLSGGGGGPLSDAVLSGSGSFPQNFPVLGTGAPAGTVLTTNPGTSLVVEMRFTVTNITGATDGITYESWVSLTLMALPSASLATGPVGSDPYVGLGLVNGDNLDLTITSLGKWQISVDVFNGVTGWAALSATFVPTGGEQVARLECSPSGVIMRLDGVIVATDTIAVATGMDGVIVRADHAGADGVPICAQMESATIMSPAEDVGDVDGMAFTASNSSNVLGMELGDVDSVALVVFNRGAIAMSIGDISTIAFTSATPGVITGNARLKRLTAQIRVTTGGFIRGNVRLPSLTGRGYTGGMRGAAVLQPLVASGVLTAPHTISGTIVLPALRTRTSTSISKLVSGGFITGRIKLPALIGGAGRMGGIVGAVRLKKLTASGRLVARETISAQIRLPSLQSEATLSLYGYPITGNIVLPALVAGNRIVGVAVLSGLTMRALLVDTSGVFEGWAYNVRTGATTRLTNLPFVQLLQVPGGNLLGIGSDGNVYEVSGDTDNGAVIPWVFETGLHDFGQPGMKRIPQVYMDAIIAGQIEITVLTDDPNAEYAYNYTTAPEAAHKPHKRKLGNRIRTRNVGFRIGSAEGAYVEFDGIEPELDQTQRSV